MRDFTIPMKNKQTLEAEEKMLASIDRIVRKKQQMARFARGSLYSITSKKKAKFRSVLSK